MKKIRTFIALIVFSMFLVGMTSCLVRTHEYDGGHRGWFYNHDHHRHGKATIIIKSDNSSSHDHDGRRGYDDNKENRESR